MEFHSTLYVFLLSMLLLCSVNLVGSQSPPTLLDDLLQDYAFQALVQPRTGTIYSGVVPLNLTGVQISALRLRSGSLRIRGVTYEEFEIPTGVNVQPYVERLVLVYQNLGNWSTLYYPLERLEGLQGFTYLAPVLGLRAYDALDLTTGNPRELEIQPSGQPISIRFSDLRSVPNGIVPQCVSFDLNNTFSLSNVLQGNICTTSRQGHFGIVAESVSPSLPPRVGPSPPDIVPRIVPVPSGGRNNSSRVGVIVGSIIGGFGLLVLLGLLVLWLRKYKGKKKMRKMERAAEVGEVLNMTSVGNTKAPAATGTRTQPTLETEYVP